MDRFQAIKIFREVARQKGFAAAGRVLNISTPTVSRLITELEEDLAVRLFSRSTRHVSLTEEGEDFLRQGVPLIEELEVLSEEIRDRRQTPRGSLRISSVVAFGQEQIAPLLAGFRASHPGLSVELDISNRKVDLVEEHFDLAIRIGGTDGLDASALKARKIFSQKLIFVAAPDYIERHGAPASLDDLSNHQIVKQISGNWGVVNRFVCNGKLIDFTLPEDFVVNSPNAARNVIMTGNAMGLIADYLVAELISKGSLVRVMDDIETPEQPIFAVFVHRNYMPAKVRAFIDYLVENLGHPKVTH